MPNLVYNTFKSSVLKGAIDFETDDISVVLVTSAYTPDVVNHVYYSDINNEVTGSGYTAGGETLQNGTVVTDNTDDEAVYDADNVTWSSSTLTARGAIIFKDTGSASTSLLIGYFDFGADKTSSNSNFTLRWNEEGILNLG